MFVVGFIGSLVMNFFKGCLEGFNFIGDDFIIEVLEGKLKFFKDRGFDGKDIVFGICLEDIYDELIVIEVNFGYMFKVMIIVVEFIGVEFMFYSCVGIYEFVVCVDVCLEY